MQFCTVTSIYQHLFHELGTYVTMNHLAIFEFEYRDISIS